MSSWVPVSSHALPRPNSSTESVPRSREGRGTEAACDVHHLVIVEVQAGHGVVRTGSFGFFLDADRLSGGAELDHSIGARIGDPIAANGRAGRARRGGLQRLAQLLSVKDIIPQHQAAALRSEKAATDEKRLRDAGRSGLRGEGEGEAPLLAGPEETLEGGEIPWRRN